MTKNEQVKLIKQAYADIPDLQDGFYDVRDRLLRMNIESERRHRHSHPTCGLSVAIAARLFTVSHLLDGYKEPKKWTIVDILSIRTECLYAQAYAEKHYKELTEWANKYSEPFSHVDYAELME